MHAASKAMRVARRPPCPYVSALSGSKADSRGPTRLRARQPCQPNRGSDWQLESLPSRARTLLDAAVEAVAHHGGIGSNWGKTRAVGACEWPPPPSIAELGDEVRRGDLRSDHRGIVVLGTPCTPVGHPNFVQSWETRRREEEERLLRLLPKLPDLQGSWLFLLLCVNAGANHALRTVPPWEILAYAREHDQAVRQTLKSNALGVLPNPQLCMRDIWRLGECTLAAWDCHQRNTQAAYCAGIADALPVLNFPSIVTRPPARTPLQRPASPYTQKVGKPAKSGERSSKELARPCRAFRRASWGFQDGRRWRFHHCM